MSLSQSESTVLHESITFSFIEWLQLYQGCMYEVSIYMYVKVPDYWYIHIICYTHQVPLLRSGLP